MGSHPTWLFDQAEKEKLEVELELTENCWSGREEGVKTADAHYMM